MYKREYDEIIETIILAKIATSSCQRNYNSKVNNNYIKL